MKNSKLLIVDDDPQNLELILEYLNDEPKSVLYAPNGQKALELAQSELPDLILLDWEMPVLDGISTIKELLKNPKTKDIPIIINSGVKLEPEHLRHALASGAIDFIRKPFDPIEFKARIAANLRIKRQHQTIVKLLEEALQRKEREITLSAMFEHAKNDLITKLMDALDKITPLQDQEIKSEVFRIRRELNGQLNLQKSWDKFKVSFEEVHPDFFNRLEQEHGAMSPNEKRLSAFLKMGLENKEIASLTHVESSSIRKALNRLKKRLNLKPEDHLRHYIEKI